MKATKFFTLMLAAPLLVPQGASGQSCGPCPPGMGTAFTYQAKIELIGGRPPFGGTCNFEFSLWDQDFSSCGPPVSAGLMIAGPLTLNDIEVEDALIMEELDFGCNAFTGAPRWLQIAMCCGAVNCIPEVLCPRQKINPAPYALEAACAENVARHNTLDEAYDQDGPGAGRTITADADPVNIAGLHGLTVNGNVGIGTTNPALKLDVHGDGYFRGGNLFVASPTQPTRTYEIRAGGRQEVHNPNDFVHFSGSNVEFVTGAPGGGTNDDFFISVGTTGNKKFTLLGATGNVGIGTANPDTQLHVNGTIKTTGTPFAAQFFGPTTTDMYYFVEPDGSATGVVDTGVFNLATNGYTNRLNIDASVVALQTRSQGKVGIGTANPAAKLHVAGDVRFHDQLTGTAIDPNFGNRMLSCQLRYDPVYRDENRVWRFRLGGEEAPQLFEIGWWDEEFDWGLVVKRSASESAGHRVGIGRIPGDPWKLDVKGNIRASGNIWAIACICASDRRLKDHIQPIASALDKVTRLRGVSFQWRGDEFPNFELGEGKQIGLIAQEVAEILPELVVHDENNMLALNYDGIIPVLIEGIKEQQQMINSTQSELDDLKQRLGALEAALGGWHAQAGGASMNASQPVEHGRASLGHGTRGSVGQGTRRADSPGLGGALTATALVLAALVGFMTHAHTRRGGAR